VRLPASVAVAIALGKALGVLLAVVDEIQDVKVTKDMLDLAKHIVNQKTATFEPEKFEDHYETALVDLINQKRAGKIIRPKERPRGENVVI
jgi:DNA end-binding protein Ku